MLSLKKKKKKKLPPSEIGCPRHCFSNLVYFYINIVKKCGKTWHHYICTWIIFAQKNYEFVHYFYSYRAITFAYFIYFFLNMLPVQFSRKCNFDSNGLWAFNKGWSSFNGCNIFSYYCHLPPYVILIPNLSCYCTLPPIIMQVQSTDPLHAHSFPILQSYSS